MFESIEGSLGAREPTRCVIECAGLGYVCHVPLSTGERLPQRGQPVRLLVHLVVREDEWKLFGFATEEERDSFRALLRVGGVGPASALGLLSGLQPDELAGAVASGDVATLVQVKGIGKKTAERIVVELRDVFQRTTQAAAAAGSGPSAAAGDAVGALAALGLDTADAQRRVAQARKRAPEAGVAELVRLSLRK